MMGETAKIYSLKNCQDAAIQVGLTEGEGSEFFDYMESQQWRWPNGQLVGELKSSLRRFKRAKDRMQSGDKKNVIQGKYCFRCGRSPEDRRIGLIYRERKPFCTEVCYKKWVLEGRPVYIQKE
jgi:hypothetical protein